jgi:leukotriene-A4 hydrolase
VAEPRPRRRAVKQPYLFSQGQAILTRTWVPTQDSPGIRQTYETPASSRRRLCVVGHERPNSLSSDRGEPAGRGP